MPSEEATQPCRNRELSKIRRSLRWADERQLLAGEHPGAWNHSSDWPGPRESRPQTRRQARSLLAAIFSRFALIAGGPPVVPAHHFTALTPSPIVQR